MHHPPHHLLWLNLQFENHKGYTIHHHTVTPTEQRKYHLSIQHQSSFAVLSYKKVLKNGVSAQPLKAKAVK